MPEPGGDFMETPVLRADATDDDLQVESEEADSPELGPVLGESATVEAPGVKLVCAVCGMDAGTCSHPQNHTTEVQA